MGVFLYHSEVNIICTSLQHLNTQFNEILVAKFSTHLHLALPSRVILSAIHQELWCGKTNIPKYLVWHWLLNDQISHFNTVPAYDTWIDRQNCCISIAVCIAMLSWHAIRTLYNFWATLTSNGSPCATRLLSCLSVTVYCGQIVGWIKMPLGTEVGLSPGDIVLSCGSMSK